MKTGRPDLDGLILWALATFHASLFLLALLVFLYWVDVLRNVLPTLNTLLGLALFIALWAITYWTTRRALKAMDTRPDFVGHATLWGAVNGVLFFLIVGLGGLLAIAANAPEPLSVLLFGPFVLAFQSLFAFGIGALVGLLFGGIDLTLLRIARALLRWRTPRARAGEPRPS